MEAPEGATGCGSSAAPSIIKAPPTTTSQEEDVQLACDQVPPQDGSPPPAPASPPPAPAPPPPPPRDACKAWVDAAKEGDVQDLQHLLRAHPGLLNAQVGGLQASAAHWAAASGHADALRHLLAAGADVALLTATGCSPLHSAAAAGRAECVQLLLASAPPPLLQLLLHAENEDGLTPAALALRHGHKLVQGMLLQAAGAGAGVGAEPADQQQQQRQQQQPGPEHAANSKQHSSTMHKGFLLRADSKSTPSSSAAGAQGPAPASANQQQGLGATVPSMSGGAGLASTGTAPQGAPAREQADAKGSHAHASSEPSAATTSASGATLLQRQHDHQQQQEQRQQQEAQHSSAAASPAAAAAPAAAVERGLGRRWLDAARAGDLSSLQQLACQHPQLLPYQGLGTSYAFVGNSALHWASAKGHTACVAWLLQHEAQRVQQQAQQGPQEQGACASSSSRLCQLVNEAGATALHTAVEHGQAACARLLVLRGGADVHLADGLGQTPVGAASGSSGAGGQLCSQRLLLWHQAAKLQRADKSAWGVADMQRLLQLAGRAADAAGCLEKRELVTLVAEVLQGLYGPVDSA